MTDIPIPADLQVRAMGTTITRLCGPVADIIVEGCNQGAAPFTALLEGTLALLDVTDELDAIVTLACLVELIQQLAQAEHPTESEGAS